MKLSSKAPILRGMNIGRTISTDLRKYIDKELRGERLLWAGQPDPKIAWKSLIGIWLFAIPWTAFALFWETMAIGGWISGTTKGMHGWAGLVMVLFGVPFVAIGLGMMAGPFWAARTARNSIYVLTDQRLVYLTERRGGVNIKSTWPKDIHSLSKSVNNDGKGSLKISYGSKRDSEGDLVEKSETVAGVGNIDELERLLREIKHGSG